MTHGLDVDAMPLHVAATAHDLIVDFLDGDFASPDLAKQFGCTLDLLVCHHVRCVSRSDWRCDSDNWRMRIVDDESTCASSSDSDVNGFVRAVEATATRERLQHDRTNNFPLVAFGDRIKTV
jgi:hypothetical protein